jgi:hypothetical protein
MPLRLWQQLRATLAERGSERVPQVTITCSSCGRTDAIAGPDPQHLESLFADWQRGGERPYSDYRGALIPDWNMGA